LLRLALVTPEARKAHRGAQFPGFGLLLAGDCQSALEICLCFRRVWLRRVKRDFSRHTQDIGFPQPVLASFLRPHRFANARASVSELTNVRMSLC
jgi:hypothetical protein